MPIAAANQDRVNAWIKTFTGIDAAAGQTARTKQSGAPAGATPEAEEPQDTEDQQNEITDGLHHVQASIATLEAGHVNTKRLRAGYQSVLKARDAAYQVRTPKFRGKALGKVFVQLNKLVVDAQNAVNAANQGGAGGASADADKLNQQIESGLQELGKITKSLGAMHSDVTKDAEAIGETLAKQHEGTRQIQDDGARAKALDQLAKRVSDGIDNVRSMLRAAQDAKPTVTNEQVEAADRGVRDLMKQLHEQIAKAKQSGLDTKQMEGEQPGLEKAHADALKLEGNAAKSKGLSTLMARLNAELRHAHALADCAAGVMGGQKGPPNEEQKNKIYQAALESGYGLKVNPPKDMKNAHFDRVFDLLGSVPPADAMQGRLKGLKFDSKVNEGKGGGEYDEKTNTITLGDIGGDDVEDYHIGGKTVKANSFNITTLHEIGHSVDTKNGVMKSHMAKSGGGGWIEIPPAKVVPTLVGLLKQSKGLGHSIPDDVLTEVITDTLAKNTYTQHAKIHDKQWDQISGWLADQILAARETKEPWKTPPNPINGKVYHEGYGDKGKPGWWYAYDIGARPGTEVSTYQWRSPAEWFAELYAITHLSKKPPPTGVDTAIAKFLWKSA
jgi:hypothetical protein